MTKHLIPQEALAHHIAFLGGTGSGKTSSAKAVIIEPALRAKERCAIIDPTGAWWGLRIKANGSNAGFPIYIFGGNHGDYPLKASDATTLAEAFGTSSDSAIFDTSLLTVADRTKFFTDFANTLLRKNRGPLRVVLDEAHLFMPQQGAQAHGGVPQMLHAANNLVSLGRSRGLQIVLISQRPAKIHKDSLSQVQTMVAMRMIGPQDRKAITEWIRDQADENQGREIIASLPSLKPGEAWVWAPIQNHLARVKFPLPLTFDSSRAPTTADGSAPVLAPINLDTLTARLGKVVEDAKANDPVKLRAILAEKDREIVLLKKSQPTGATEYELDVAHATGYQKGQIDTEIKLSQYYAELVSRFVEDMKKYPTTKVTSSPAIPNAPHKVYVGPQIVRPKPSNIENKDTSLGKGERITLIAIAQHHHGVTRQQLTILTGYKRSTRDAYLQRIFQKGYAIPGDRIHATDDGISVLGDDYEKLPIGDALRAHVLATLPEGERKILEIVAEAHPNEIGRDSISEQTNYARSSRDAYIQRLSARELIITVGRGDVRAADTLFG